MTIYYNVEINAENGGQTPFSAFFSAVLSFFCGKSVGAANGINDSALDNIDKNERGKLCNIAFYLFCRKNAVKTRQKKIKYSKKNLKTY